MFYSSKLHKLSVLCASLFCIGTLILTSCDNPSVNPENTDTPQNQPEETKTSQLEIGTSTADEDVFVMTSLNSLIKDFDYNLYEDSACTDKVLYKTASYFLTSGSDTYYFSNVFSYDSENKTLYVEVIKNGQMNKDSTAFIFTSENRSYLTTLKIIGLAKIMTGGSVEIYENSFNSTDFKLAWNDRTENWNKVSTVYYKQKTDFTQLKKLPEISSEICYLLDGNGEYVLTYEDKAYSVRFSEYNIERPSMSQNLYQITSDENYYYFGFSETSRNSYNEALLDNYLGMPAICRIYFNEDLTKIIISNSIYLSQAKPEFEDQEWKETEYSFTEDEPPVSESEIPSEEATDLEVLQNLVKSLISDYYWKDIPNPDGTTNNYRCWFGSTTSTGTTPLTFFTYFRIKGQVKGLGIYKENTVSKPTDNLYTDEIYSDETTVAVYGHLADTSGPAAPKGAVYPPNDDDTGKYALWILSSEGIKCSQLFESLDDCKKGPYTFEEFTWE